MENLRFTCQPNCTNCCDQQGFVYLSESDVIHAAEYVGMSAKDFEAKYVYRTRNLIRLRKPRGKQCHFLLEKGCAIHPSKPTQCRAFPFWPELVESRRNWNETAKYCPGIGTGQLIQIGTALEMAEVMKKAYPGMYEKPDKPL
ncbi:MAG: YkgJ family cysteine cluster protein [Bryobacteraceae bacterium]